VAAAVLGRPLLREGRPVIALIETDGYFADS